MYNGTTYQPGEMFTTSELFPSRQPNQCVQCSCSEGQIYCGLVTCPDLLCSSPLTVPDSCCQVCQGNMGTSPLDGNRNPDPSGRKAPYRGTIRLLLFIVTLLSFSSACVYNGKTYSHGEVWHPVFRLYGVLPCILCTCTDGIQDCQKVTCPKEYPCEYPEKVEGKCCKICPECPDPGPTDEINTPRCAKNPNRVSVYMFVPPSSESPKEDLRKIAIEKDSSEEVEIYSWKLVKGESGE
uniref:Chordin like 2 n=1 Tax=Chrysemys picta bellii TaxID=8478 RepID=A0A8C3FAL0_CHRPI